MTTIFGLKHPTINASILVADRQGTYFNKGMPTGKILGRKLWTSKGGNYCFGHAGDYDNQTDELIQKLVSEEYCIGEIVSQKNFPALRELNIKKMGNHLPNLEKMSGLVLATRFDGQPRLYTCFPLGSVEERIWTTVGSGEKHVEDYMRALEVLTEAKSYEGSTVNPSLPDAIMIGLEAVRRAQGKDVYSHGLDLLICTPEGIKDHYNDLTDQFGETLKKVQEQYKK